MEIVQDFLENAEHPQILIKDITNDELKKLFTQFPNLVPILFQKEKIKNEIEFQEISIVKVITLVKNKKDLMSLNKINKLKIYFDETNNKILKILNI